MIRPMFFTITFGLVFSNLLPRSSVVLTMSVRFFNIYLCIYCFSLVVIRVFVFLCRFRVALYTKLKKPVIGYQTLKKIRGKPCAIDSSANYMFSLPCACPYMFVSIVSCCLLFIDWFQLVYVLAICYSLVLHVRQLVVIASMLFYS